MSRLRVLHVASELFPVAKTGGLADVAHALPAAQLRLDLDAAVVIPGYPATMRLMRGQEMILSDPNLFGTGPCRVWKTGFDGVDVPVFTVESTALFDRQGTPYQGLDGKDFADNDLRFAALGWAAARLANGVGRVPPFDVVHAHDWQAGLTHAYLAHVPRWQHRPARVTTIHNVAFKGVFPAERFAQLGLPDAALSMHGLEYFGGVGFLKAGIFYADKVTTVSPTHAQEITTTEGAQGLEGLLSEREPVGILNGIDRSVWDPARDQTLSLRYDASTVVEGKQTAARHLRELTASSLTKGPVFGVVSRLTWHKGLDLLPGAAKAVLDEGAELVILGRGEPEIEAGFTALQQQYPSQVSVTLGYDEGLAHQIYAGSDVILVPSRAEPCGLTQMYALAYGALPLVRRTGGLADTVIDANAETMGDGTATGFVFDEPDEISLSAAMLRAQALFQSAPEAWRAIQQTAMAQSFDWKRSARRYREVYEEALAIARA